MPRTRARHRTIGHPAVPSPSDPVMTIAETSDGPDRGSTACISQRRRRMARSCLREPAGEFPMSPPSIIDCGRATPRMPAPHRQPRRTAPGDRAGTSCPYAADSNSPNPMSRPLRNGPGRPDPPLGAAFDPAERRRVSMTWGMEDAAPVRTCSHSMQLPVRCRALTYQHRRHAEQPRARHEFLCAGR